MATTGNAYGTQDGVVYLRKSESLDPFIWGGRCMRLEEGTETLGGLAVTTRFDPRGGVERAGVRREVPGTATGSLVMKRVQGDRMKTELRTCLWDVDQRMHCSGADRDSPFKWEEITRYCRAKMSDRAVAGSTWEADEDAMVTFTMTAEYVNDIYRVTGEEATVLGTSTSTSTTLSTSTSSTISTSTTSSTSVSTSSTSVSTSSTSISTSTTQSVSTSISTSSTSQSTSLTTSSSTSISVSTSSTSQSTSTTVSTSLSTSTSMT